MFERMMSNAERNPLNIFGCYIADWKSVSVIYTELVAREKWCCYDDKRSIPTRQRETWTFYLIGSVLGGKDKEELFSILGRLGCL